MTALGLDAKHAITVLARLAMRRPEGQALLKASFASPTRLRAFLQEAIEATIAVGGPIDNILAECLKNIQDPVLIREILAIVPGRSFALRNVALVATEQLYDEVRRVTQDLPDPQIAKLSFDLSFRYHEIGHYDLAFAFARGAADAYRILENKSPGQFEEELTSAVYALSELSSQHLLDNIGIDQALTFAKEVLDRYKALAEKSTGKITHMVRVANAKQGLAGLLWENRQFEEALLIMKEVVVELRRLPVTDMEDFWEHGGESAVCLPLALLNLGTLLHALRREAEAYIAAKEGISLFRDQAMRDPDTKELSFAGALSGFVGIAGAAGHPEEAVEVAYEAVRTYRRHIKQPLVFMAHDFVPGLALALFNLAVALGATGQYEQAIPTAQDCIATFKELKERDPSRFWRNEIGVVILLADLCLQAGREREAQLARDEAHKLADEAFMWYNASAAELNGLMHRIGM